MAIVKNNLLIEGLSGMYGDLVFKQIRGKTIVARKASKAIEQSESQKQTRSKFREASRMAKQLMLDPEKKKHYQQRAKILKLPNAYTAALKEFMSSPV